MWTAATWLLQDIIHLRPDDNAIQTAEVRLRHFLQIKVDYGYYEFFSTNYYPFTLSALLNIYDFAPQADIRALAGAAATRLLKDWILMTTERGYFYPVAGRNQNHRYEPIYYSITWILLGRGTPLGDHSWRRDPAAIGAVLTTTSFDLEPFAGLYYQPVTFYRGHDITEHARIHAVLNRDDRTLFQMSAGAGNQPSVVADSQYLKTKYKLEGSSFWNEISYFVRQLIPDFLVSFVASLAPRGTIQGADLSGSTIALFKHYDIMLTSSQDNQAGLRSSRQFTWMATVGDIPVYTQAGVAGDCFEDMNSSIDSHLPHLVQEHNVALIAYRPWWDANFLFRLFLSSGNIEQVALHLPEERLDDMVENGRWLLGRQADSYIGIWRHGLLRTKCEGRVPCREYYYSDASTGGRQTWVAVVGNEKTHGSFADFVVSVSKGEVTESHPSFWEQVFFRGRYEAQVSVDGKTLSASL